MISAKQGPESDGLRTSLRLMSGTKKSSLLAEQGVARDDSLNIIGKFIPGTNEFL